MAKILVVYFSRTGTNKEIANKTKRYLNCDIDEIIDLWGKRNIISGGFSALFKKTTKINFNKNPKDYNFLILVTPVWVGTLPPAARTYLLENKEIIKKTILLSVSGSGQENKKIIKEMESLLEKKILEKLMLKEKEFNSKSYKKEFEKFLKKVEKITQLK